MSPNNEKISRISKNMKGKWVQERLKIVLPIFKNTKWILVINLRISEALGSSYFKGWGSSPLSHLSFTPQHKDSCPHQFVLNCTWQGHNKCLEGDPNGPFPASFNLTFWQYLTSLVTPVSLKYCYPLILDFLSPIFLQNTLLRLFFSLFFF